MRRKIMFSMLSAIP